MTQQGLLVLHIMNEGDTLDLGSAASRVSTKRESMLQNAHRKMFPAIPGPQSVEDLREHGRLSLVSYLERFGGYAHQKELGMVLLLLAYIGDALAQGDARGAQEHLALAMMSVEQASLFS